jgi:hypothetical protein
MPSTETQGQQPGEHTGGAGSLPGPKDEQGVAVLPEELAVKATETDRPESREEPREVPDKTKSTGAGGATDSSKPAQSRVRTDFLFAILQMFVDPERMHNGLVATTSRVSNSSRAFTLWAVIFPAGME